MLPELPAQSWREQATVAKAAEHLLETLDALDLRDPARIDTHTAVESVPGVTVIEDWSLRPKTCPIDGTYLAETQTISYRPMSERRDRFTLLHELGHHLLALDTQWSLGIAPMLDQAGVGVLVEERIVNEFAARVLIPEQDAHTAFERGVNAEAVARLYDRGQASASACLVRALSHPGERLVMLTDLTGHPWFVDSTGEPFSPGKHVHQPALETAAARAAQAGGTFTGVGLGGIAYKSGKTFSDVKIDIALRGALVFAVITALPRDVRVSGDSAEWRVVCIDGCGREFRQEESPGICSECQEPRCPGCRQCACSTPVLCERCFIALPVLRQSRGLCEDCE